MIGTFAGCSVDFPSNHPSGNGWSQGQGPKKSFDVLIFDEDRNHSKFHRIIPGKSDREF